MSPPAARAREGAGQSERQGDQIGRLAHTLHTSIRPEVVSTEASRPLLDARQPLQAGRP